MSPRLEICEKSGLVLNSLIKILKVGKFAGNFDRDVMITFLSPLEIFIKNTQNTKNREKLIVIFDKNPVKSN